MTMTDQDRTPVDHWSAPGHRWHEERHPVWQLVLGVVGFVAAQLLNGVVTAVTGLVPLGLVVQAGVGAASFWLVVRFVGRRRPWELAGPRWWAELLAGLGVGAALFSLVVAVLAIAGAYTIEGAALRPGLLTGLAIGLGAGVAEEVLFRGFLLRLVNRWAGTGIALATTSLFFGLAHLGNSGATLFGAAAIAIEAGVLLGAAYLVTGRLWLAIGIHAAWNAVQGGVFSLSVSGTQRLDGVFASTVTGPDWLTGGAMGPEASVPALVIASLAGAATVVWCVRKGRFTGRLVSGPPTHLGSRI